MITDVLVLRRQYNEAKRTVVELSLFRAHDYRGLAFFRRFFELGEAPSTEVILARVNEDNIAYYKSLDAPQYRCVQEKPR